MQIQNKSATARHWPIHGDMRTANHQEKASDGTNTAISDHPAQKGTGISSCTLNSPFQTPICELWGTGREHTDAQHNTRAYAVQHHRTAAGTHITLQQKTHSRLLCLPSQTTAATITTLQLGYVQVAPHSGPALSGYLAQRRNLVGRGPNFFMGNLISVNQTSDNKGAICCCLWNWVISVGGQGGWREYGKIFPTLSLQTHHPICTNARHSFWQTTWCLVVFYSQIVDSN